MANESAPLTAQVVLRPASGAEAEPVTTETLARQLPSPEMVNRAQEGFRQLGFTTGQASGVGFSIAAPRATFEAVFHVTIDVDPRGFAKLSQAGGDVIDLPVGVLPDSLRVVTNAVGFQRPLDFGPTGSFH